MFIRVRCTGCVSPISFEISEQFCSGNYRVNFHHNFTKKKKITTKIPFIALFMMIFFNLYHIDRIYRYFVKLLNQVQQMIVTIT